MLEAGAGLVAITPPLGTPLSGAFEYREVETVADDLFARALVLDDGSGRLALVICDVICITAATVAAARDRIRQRCGIPASHVMISCTHTHTGPATAPLLSGDPDQGYVDWLPGQIADAVEIACSRLVPAQAVHGVADVDGVCFNRRFRMRDGTVVFNPGAGNPEIIEPVGPVDPEVTALLVEDHAGEPIALWANLSLHYVGTDDPVAVSADYFGHFAEAVSRTLGSECIGLLTNGTSGEINSIDVSRTAKESRTARSRRVATVVAAGAIAATTMQRRECEVTLDARLVPFRVARRSITPQDVTLANAILSTSAEPTPAQAAGFSFVVGQPIPLHQLRTYASEVLGVAEMPAERMTEVQVMRIGDLALVALPGEMFVKFGLTIKAESPFERTAVVSLANDYVGYVPTLEAFEQGAYETWAARSAWPQPGTGERMTHEALAALNDLKAGQPMAVPA